MVVFPDLSIYKNGFTYSKSNTQRFINNILFNDFVKICLNKSLLDIIEKEVEDTDHFEAAIKELYDCDKIVVKESTIDNSFDFQYSEIFQKSCFPVFFPITLKLNNKLPLQKHDYIIVKDESSSKKNSVVLDLLTKNISSVSFLDFSNNNEIKLFFENLYNIPKTISYFNIFNRDLESTYLTALKGFRINYYTLIRKKDIKYAANDKKEIIKILGRKTKIHFTSNPRIIHERKIIFENILITVDNAFENTIIEEPTWQIQISYNPSLASEWLKKCYSFREVRG
tara:strand:+ start:12557 stop:13405 length:849 start_codon:yes stop_codon:yes gene_type:complete